MAGYIFLQLDQGSTFSKTFDLMDSNNAPVNLTGFTAQSTLRASYVSNERVYTLTATVDSPETNGTITLSATAAETSLMKAGRYIFDLQITSGATVNKLVDGIIEIKAQATQQ